MIEIVDYPHALEQMALLRDKNPLIWFLQHPHLYSLGNRGSIADINNIYNLPVYPSSRGGQVTYHGPGQLMGYCFFDLQKLGMTVHDYVAWLEDIIIQTLGDFGIEGKAGPQPGIWVEGAKIASIGVRIQRHITSHGFALNVCNDLKYFAPIRSCGVDAAKVTSMAELIGEPPHIDAVAHAIYAKFCSTNSQFTRFARNFST